MHTSMPLKKDIASLVSVIACLFTSQLDARLFGKKYNSRFTVNGGRLFRNRMEI
ncbi:hypothetical protein LFYK43_10450 [Ligilactobacillus salitolerans]|uniref:Uncharacterized protein n=1 Tax=Ligilactobacillus salitolerans TaxID=1808352 RepID=A0A401IST5_9LACO|nr:hypothetical protein LFYK43_10450 [Ligilactobacillus salitolerans]